MNELALFAGAGGGILGGHLLGWRTVCAVEFAAYPRSVLLARQRDGMLPKFPVWDDVRTFDGKPWRGHVDVISGGFPCQDISVAGRGDGLDGERSGLWSEMARIIGEVQPRFAFVENSPMLTSRGLDRVLGDLSEMGMDAVWGTVSASDAGAPHRRERIWILAYAADAGLHERRGSSGIEPDVFGLRRDERDGLPCEPKEEAEPLDASQHPIGQLADADVFGRLHGQVEERSTERRIHAQREPEPSGQDLADAGRIGLRGEGYTEDAGAAGAREGNEQEWERLRVDHFASCGSGGGWWKSEPRVGGMVDELAPELDPHGAIAGEVFPRVATGIPKRVDRLKAIGNGQVPAAVVLAWNTLYSRIQQR